MKINSFSRLFAAVKFRDYVESLPHLYEVALPIQQSIKMPTPPKLYDSFCEFNISTCVIGFFNQAFLRTCESFARSHLFLLCFQGLCLIFSVLCFRSQKKGTSVKCPNNVAHRFLPVNPDNLSGSKAIG